MKVTLGPHDPAHPYFLYSFSGVGVPLSLLIHQRGALLPGGTCNGGGAYGGGLISVSKSIRFRFEDSCKTGFGPLFFLASSGGVGVFHNQGLYIRRIREFVNKINHLGGSSTRSCQTITYGTWPGWPPCLRIIAATALLVRYADKLTYRQQLWVYTPMPSKGF